jgi:GTP-binding protein
MSGREPAEDFQIILNELASFSTELAKKPMFVVATKMDAAQDPERLAQLENAARSLKMQVFQISAVTGAGLPELLRAVARLVLPPLPNVHVQ